MDSVLVCQITWELFEHNWHFELLNLDHAALPDIWAKDHKTFTQHDLVMTLFPGNGSLFIWTGEFPTKDKGIASRDWQERQEFVEIFRHIVSLWPNPPSLVLDGCLEKTSSKLEVEKMERLVVSFYLQSFWDFFGRAAICPRYIPHSDSNDA